MGSQNNWLGLVQDDVWLGTFFLGVCYLWTPDMDT